VIGADLDPEIGVVFLEEARGYLRTLENPAVSASEKQAAAHSLKSAAGLVGLPELRAAAEAAERFLRARELDAAAAQVTRAATLVLELDALMAKPPAGAGAGLGDNSGFDADETALLRSFFLDEAQEHLEGITSTLIALEREPGRRDLVDVLLRKTHTLKGSAATVGLAAAAEAAHRLEDVFAQLRSGRLAMSTERLDALVGAVDTVRSVALATDAAAARERLAAMIALLDAATAREAIPQHLDPADSGESTEPPTSRAVARIDSSSGPHPDPTPDESSTRDDDSSLFDDRRGASERRAGGPQLLRVEAARVDVLMDAVGELVFDRTRIERRAQELRGVTKELSKTRAALRLMLAPLRAAGAAAEQGVRPSSEAIYNVVQRITDLEGELAVQSAQLARTTATLADDTEALRRTSSQLQTGLTQVRMMSVRGLFSRLARPLRELARKAGKRVELNTSGEETELDKTVVDQIVDPLVQIVRNAVVHGIETPEQRLRAGKPATGHVTMSARHQGDGVYLEIADDGAGIDVERLRTMLVQQGRLGEAQARLMKPERIMAAIFEAGISTRDEADELAGRGVGLDVVREAIARLGGEISVTSVRGEGTRFTLRLPLTTAIAQALLFKVGGQVYALPNVHVLQTTWIEASSPAMPTHVAIPSSDGGPVPLVSLHELLGAEAPRDSRRVPAVVLEFAGRRLAATCDKVIGPREIIIKSIGPLLAPLGIYAGATISGAGKVQLILDSAALAQLAYPPVPGDEAVPHPIETGASASVNVAVPLPAAMGGHTHVAHVVRDSTRDTGSQPALRNLPPSTPSAQMAAAAPPRRVLVADDSRTVRETVSRILGGAGYIVDTATDGIEAWDMLKDVEYDLLVTDLEMPRLGGFELLEKVRTGHATKLMPVLVISSRSAEVHRLRAAQMGANAFMAKPVQKPQLMEQVVALLR
jgi:chemosensory pili system protein ChpA (sensor histidine kinase/response regulator)